jgi:hypothetical protein
MTFGGVPIGRGARCARTSTSTQSRSGVSPQVANAARTRTNAGRTLRALREDARMSCFGVGYASSKQRCGDEDTACCEGAASLRLQYSLSDSSACLAASRSSAGQAPAGFPRPFVLELDSQQQQPSRRSPAIQHDALAKRALSPAPARARSATTIFGVIRGDASVGARDPRLSRRSCGCSRRRPACSVSVCWPGA